MPYCAYRAPQKGRGGCNSTSIAIRQAITLIASKAAELRRIALHHAKEECKRMLSKPRRRAKPLSATAPTSSHLRKCYTSGPKLSMAGERVPWSSFVYLHYTTAKRLSRNDSYYACDTIGRSGACGRRKDHGLAYRSCFALILAWIACFVNARLLARHRWGSLVSTLDKKHRPAAWMQSFIAY